jgi:hypothetical protein
MWTKRAWLRKEGLFKRAMNSARKKRAKAINPAMTARKPIRICLVFMIPYWSISKD